MTRLFALAAAVAAATACSATTSGGKNVYLTDANLDGTTSLVVATTTADATCAKDGKVAKLVSSDRKSETYVCVEPDAAGAD